MKKQKSVKATLRFAPTLNAADKKNAIASLRGPLIGNLVITGWKNACPVTCEVQGTIVKPEKPKKVSAAKSIKARAPRGGKPKAR